MVRTVVNRAVLRIYRRYPYSGSGFRNLDSIVFDSVTLDYFRRAPRTHHCRNNNHSRRSIATSDSRRGSDDMLFFSSAKLNGRKTTRTKYDVTRKTVVKTAPNNRKRVSGTYTYIHIHTPYVRIFRRFFDFRRYFHTRAQANRHSGRQRARDTKTNPTIFHFFVEFLTHLPFKTRAYVHTHICMCIHTYTYFVRYNTPFGLHTTGSTYT